MEKILEKVSEKQIVENGAYITNALTNGEKIIDYISGERPLYWSEVLVYPQNDFTIVTRILRKGILLVDCEDEIPTLREQTLINLGKKRFFNISNYDVSSNYFECEGILRELGDYSGYFQQLAYEIMGIEGEFVEDEWCDIFFNEDTKKIYAVYGNCEVTSTDGNFRFYEIKKEHKDYDYLMERMMSVHGFNFSEEKK